MSLISRTALVLACAALAACSPTPATLAYAPSRPAAPGPAAIAGVTTQDIRGIGPESLAVTRSLYGHPAGLAQTGQPADRAVSDAFAAALTQRGMLAPAAPYRMVVMLRRLQADASVADRTAAIGLDLLVLNQAGGIVYKDRYEAVDDGLAPFSGPAALAARMQAMLATAIDTLLDRPALRRLLGQPGPLPVLPIA